MNEYTGYDGPIQFTTTPLPEVFISYVDKSGITRIIQGVNGTTIDDLALRVPDGAQYKEITESQATAILMGIQAIKTAKIAEILSGANAMSTAIKAKYSQPEIDSWQLQEAEARAVIAGSTVAPLVTKLAANAGVTALEFAQRIISNADAAAAATEAIILQQQAMERAVKEAVSVEAVQSVKVEYHLGQ